nr:glycine oxidase ThiO [Corynebacterium heidelbergense]
MQRGAAPGGKVGLRRGGHGPHTKVDRMHIGIVGAGLIGVATARELSRRGHRVTLVDPEPLSGATHAAAGMLAPVAEVTYDQDDLYPLMATSARMYPEFLAGIEADAAYRTTETLVIAADAADREFLATLAEFQRRMDMECEVITTRAARALEPNLGTAIAGAVRIPGDHQVDPRRLGSALLAQVLQAGGQVRRTRVKAIEAENGPILRLAEGEDLRVDHVLVANGLNAPELVDLPIRAVHGDVIRMMMPAHRDHLITSTVRAMVQGRPVYLVPRADGSLVLGATSREDDLTGVSAEGVFQLLHDAHRILPSVWECEITELTARARPASGDDVPIIDRVADHISVAAGFSRHGILLAPIGARLAADVVLGEGGNGPLAQSVRLRRFTHSPLEHSTRK